MENRNSIKYLFNKKERKIENFKLELEIQKLKLEIKEHNKFTRKDFFIYLMPVTFQLMTVAIGAFILYKSNFFEIQNILIKTDNSKLELENEKLTLRKSNLHDSILFLTNNRNLLTQQLEEEQFSYDSLKTSHKLLNEEVEKLTNSQIEKIISDLINGYYNIDNQEIQNLIQHSTNNKNNTNKYIEILDKKTNKGDNLDIKKLIENIQLSQLKYYMNIYPKSRQEYLKNISEYFKVAKSLPTSYNHIVLNSLIYHKWSIVEIDENLTILWNEGFVKDDYNKIIQICQWATFPIMKEDYVLEAKLDYLPDLYKLIYNETKDMTTNTTFLIKNLDNTLQQKFLLSMFSTCPQCYYATEILTLKNNIDNANNAMLSNVLNIQLSLDTIDMLTTHISDPTSISILKISSLITAHNIDNYSPFLKAIHFRFVKKHDIPDFRHLIGEDFPKFASELNSFYNIHEDKIKYWTSPERILDFSNKEFRRKIKTEAF